MGQVHEPNAVICHVPLYLDKQTKNNKHRHKHRLDSSRRVAIIEAKELPITVIWSQQESVVLETVLLFDRNVTSLCFSDESPTYLFHQTIQQPTNQPTNQPTKTTKQANELDDGILRSQALLGC